MATALKIHVRSTAPYPERIRIVGRQSHRGSAMDIPPSQASAAWPTRPSQRLKPPISLQSPGPDISNNPSTGPSPQPRVVPGGSRCLSIWPRGMLPHQKSAGLFHGAIFGLRIAGGCTSNRNPISIAGMPAVHSAANAQACEPARLVMKYSDAAVLKLPTQTGSRHLEPEYSRDGLANSPNPTRQGSVASAWSPAMSAILLTASAA